MVDLSIVIIGSYDYLENYKTLRNIKIAIKNCPQKFEIFILLPTIEKQKLNGKNQLRSIIESVQIKDQIDLSIDNVQKFTINHASGNSIFFIKSGDYISLNLFKEFFQINKNKNDIMFVTEKKVFFGSEYYTEDNIVLDSEDFTKFSLLIQDNWNLNPWGSSFFISQNYLRMVNMPKKIDEWKLGTELSTFLCKLLESKVQIVLIPKTISFFNKSEKSQKNLKNYIIPKTKLFEIKSRTKRYKDVTEYKDKDSIKSQFIINLSFRFPSIYSFLIRIKEVLNNIKIFFKNREDNRNIVKRIFSKLFPTFYLKIYVLKRNLLGITKKELLYPDWMSKEWSAINEIEPILFPPSQKIFHNKLLFNSKLDKYYQELLLCFDKDIDFLVFCPWLKRGGADKLAINLMKGINTLFPSKKIGLILTEKTISEMKEYIPENIQFFDLGNNFIDLNPVEKEALLLRFIIQNSPKRIININSHSLFNLLLKYSKPISYYSKIFCFCFSPSRTQEGQLTGFAFNFIPQIIDDLELVLTDNQNIIDVLVEMYGLDKKKFKVLYQPVEVEKYIRRDYSNKKVWNVLWASRIDYEKLPDVLKKIVSKSDKSNIKFHIYGSSVIDKEYPLKKFNRYKNTFTYGAYTGGLKGIKNCSDYDIFLYTSWFDGMPNTILEALSLGIPVISSNVGGIKEIIEDKKTGFLVDDIYNDSKYRLLINKIVNKPELLNSIRYNAYKKISMQHSWTRYLQLLKNIFK